MFRRLGLAAVGIVILLVILLVSVGIDLWTDVIWYQSVGFVSVLSTRLGAQLGLFLAGLAIALVVLLGTLWLAGRLAGLEPSGGVLLATVATAYLVLDPSAAADPVTGSGPAS